MATVARTCVFLTSAVAMDGERASGAAQRRRERRFRAWQRHVRTAVQLALAEKLHHSAGPVEQHDALRRQKNARVRQKGEEHGTYDTTRGLSAPLPGTRPAPLPEVAGPQGRPVAPLSPGAGVPSLASPALAGATGEMVDSSALAFLAARAVQVREEEEAEELRQLDEVLATAEDRLVEALDPLRHDESRPRWSSLSPVEQAACHWYAAGLRREKRKRRKKRRRTKTTRRTRFSTATVSSTSVCSVLASVSRQT